MRRTGRGQLTQSEDVSTLPVISLFVILVTFLVTAASSVGLASYEVQVPVAREGEGGGSGTATASVTVEIWPEDFVVEATGPGGDAVTTTIARDAPGAVQSVGRALVAAREQHGEIREMVLVPAPDVSYEEVVSVAEQGRRAGIPGLSLATTAPGTDEGGA